MADDLDLLDTLLLGGLPVELRELNVLLPAVALQRRGEAFGELDGEVAWLVAREPLFKGLEGRSDRLLRLLAAP